MKMFLILFVASVLALTALPASYANGVGVVGAHAPDFQGRELDSKKTWRPSDAAGRPVALYFFCGCDVCHACARQWEAVRERGVLDSVRPGASVPLTVVVMAGDSDSTRQFVQETHLVGKDLVLIPDKSLALTRLYGAETCPRVFVIGVDGLVRYTNSATRDPVMIVAQALSSIRAK